MSRRQANLLRQSKDSDKLMKLAQQLRRIVSYSYEVELIHDSIVITIRSKTKEKYNDRGPMR